MFHQDQITLPPEVAHMALFAHAGDKLQTEFNPNDPELSRDPQYRAAAGRLISIKSKIERVEAKAERTDADEDRLDDLYAEFDEMAGLLEDRGRKLTNNTRRSPHWEYTGQHAPKTRALDDHKTGGLFASAKADDNHGFRNFGEFVQSVAGTVAGRFDQRLQQPRNTFEEGTGSSGGFLVPAQFRSEILGPALVQSEVLSRVRTLPMPNGNLQVAGADTENHTSGSIGGLTLSWVAENAELSAQTPQVRAINLRAKKAAILTHCSNELLMDAPAASGQLQNLFTEAAMHGLEAAVLTGNGVGQPLGLLSGDAIVSVAKEGSQAADTFVRENAVKMLARLHPGLVKNALWVCNPSVLPALLELSFRVQNAAASDYVGGQLEPVQLEDGSYKLLGLPVAFSESLPVLGDLNDIALISPDQYVLGSTLDLSVEASPHQRFNFDQTVFRLILRVDGQPLWSQPLTPRNGSTLAPAVVLAERA